MTFFNKSCHTQIGKMGITTSIVLKMLLVNSRIRSSHGCAVALGKPNHGHSWCIGTGHRTTKWWTDESASGRERSWFCYQNHVEKYNWSEYLSAGCSWSSHFWWEEYFENWRVGCYWSSRYCHIQRLCVLPGTLFTTILHLAYCF